MPFGLSGAYDYYQTEIFNITFLIAGGSRIQRMSITNDALIRLMAVMI